ncbi:hypothetical protein EJ06DRAFT_559466 [Trichodelitschia bisporula]|uniref:ADF-H domain-containing protein n=1 Tax=Trichodelitschia bisporula TaxID=703511 RepID=A0A6G1HLT0_9PEZI|nr:hypothetical protein EJ06DRAFT_559466 [Trichodelitschia bisporula]
MSLSGLDSPEVESALQTVQLGRTGWFLLKYNSRDSVEVLGHGTGGLGEMREAADAYYDAEMSQRNPLYGMIDFRRRKVLVKLVLEGSSRLMQARVQVHWTSVVARFPNHETVFEPTATAQLNESGLTAHIELHSSRSSSSSGKKPALDGIIEDAEEVATTTAAAAPAATIHKRDDSTSTSKPSETTPTPPTPTPSSPEALVAPRPKTSASQMSVMNGNIPTLAPGLSADYAASINTTNDYYFDSTRRISSQSARPSTGDLYNFYKPKVKLGPRPSIERPGQSNNSESRPVATLPARLRASRPPKLSPSRPESRDSSMTIRSHFPPPPPIPESPTFGPRPGSSSQSVKSLPATLPKSPGMTPEKARLMKFREMYKQREALAKKKPVTPVPEIVDPDPEPERLADDNTDSGVGLDDDEDKVETEGSAEALPKSLRGEGVASEATDGATNGFKGANGEVGFNGGIAEITTASHPHSVSEASMPDNMASTDEESIADPATPSTVVEVKIHEPVNGVEEEEVNGVHGATETVPKASTETTPSAAADGEPTKDTNAKDANCASPTAAESLTTITNGSSATNPATNHSTTSTPTGDTITVFDLPNSSSVSIIEPPANPSPSHPDEKEKRTALVAPLELIDSHSDADADADYDDDLLDELHAAEVHEAKSMSVSKSPITPFFPRRTSAHNGSMLPTDRPQSSSSRPTTPARLGDTMRPPSPTPSARSGRFPARLTVVPPEDGNITVSKRVKPNGGIAAKIADLQRSFSRGSVVSLAPSPTGGKSNLVSARTTALATTTPPRSSSNGIVPGLRARSFSRTSFSSRETLSPSRETSASPKMTARDAPRAESRSIINRISSYNRLPKMESISVTATIVRTDKDKKPALAPPVDPAPIALHESPLTINRRRAPSPGPALPGAEKGIHHRTKSSISRLSMKSASTTSLALPQSPDGREVAPRASLESSWRSLARRRSESKSPSAHGLPRSMSNSSLDTAASGESGTGAGKKVSRASRLMKRMSSSIASVSRLPLGPLSPNAVKEEESEPAEEALSPQRPPATDVGDVDVQFPDTLLWKRRWVEVDGQGFLMLRPYGGNERANGVTKRYHLNEFNAPFVPDLERQEMPNSIIMDFRDGRTLQCACQTSDGQKLVLQILRDSHRAWCQR